MVCVAADAASEGNSLVKGQLRKRRREKSPESALKHGRMDSSNEGVGLAQFLQPKPQAVDTPVWQTSVTTDAKPGLTSSNSTHLPQNCNIIATGSTTCSNLRAEIERMVTIQFDLARPKFEAEIRRNVLDQFEVMGAERMAGIQQKLPGKKVVDKDEAVYVTTGAAPPAELSDSFGSSLAGSSMASSSSAYNNAVVSALSISSFSNPSRPKFSSSQQNNLPPHKAVLAPMVGGSELAFRMLCRRYGVDLCYTPMMYASKFLSDAEYRTKEFHTVATDRPLVVHFCGNDPATLLAAAKLVEKDCDAIDLNLGCPQRIAHSGHFGSYLLGQEDRKLVVSIVKTLAEGLSIPVFCKIRLLDTVPETVDLCKALAGAGCRLIAVHGRYRGTPTARRPGPAHLDQVAAVKRAMGPFPILSNGNVREPADIAANLTKTKANGIMSAEGLLDDPGLFARAKTADKVYTPATKTSTSVTSVSIELVSKELKKIEKKVREITRLEGLDRALTKDELSKISKQTQLEAEVASLKAMATIDDHSKMTAATVGESNVVPGSGLQLALEYLDLCKKYPSATLQMMVFHIRRMCRSELMKYQLLDACIAADNPDALRKIVKQCVKYSSGRTSFVEDPAVQRRQNEAADRRKIEQKKRRDYETRMIRKARREGVDEYKYLDLGSSPPGPLDIQAVIAIPEPQRMSWWRERFAQHCFAFHCAKDGCTRERACAFLHAELTSASDPSWLREDQEEPE